jgi:RNA polymerase sigma factor (sigma-70 family)
LNRQHEIGVLNDEELVELCLKGRSSAQEQFYHRFAPKMMSVCLRYSDDYEEAQDSMQDGFVQVFKMLHTYKGEGSLEGWVRRVIVNTAINNLKRLKKHKNLSDVEEVGFMLQGDDEDAVVGDMAVDDLMQIINRLPSGYRTVFNMYAIEGYSHKEIADTLEVTESTSKTQYRKAKLHIQKLMKEYKITQ